jgi:hypothetical protein
MMNIACVDGTVVAQVHAVLRHYGVIHVRQQGPTGSSPMMWVMVDVQIGQDKERAMRRAIAQLPGASIRS